MILIILNVCVSFDHVSISPLYFGYEVMSSVVPLFVVIGIMIAPSQ